MGALQPASPVLGGDADAHGCAVSAGYSWCASAGACVRPWETPCAAERASADADARCTSQHPALAARLASLLRSVNGTHAESARWRHARGDRFFYVHYDHSTGAMTGCACGRQAPKGIQPEEQLAANAGAKLSQLCTREGSTRAFLLAAL